MLILARLLTNFDALIGDVEFDSQAASQTGTGGIASIAYGMLTFMTRLDPLMQVVGALVLLVAVAMVAVYWLL